MARQHTYFSYASINRFSSQLCITLFLNKPPQAFPLLKKGSPHSPIPNHLPINVVVE